MNQEINLHSKYIIRPINFGDEKKILSVALNSWLYTYSDIYTKKTIEEFVNRNYSANKLLNIIEDQNSGLTLFLIVEEISNMNIIGFAQIGFDNYWIAPTEKIIDSIIRLFRIYLDPIHIGLGIGSSLLIEVEKFVIKNNQSSYIVGVHKSNIKAINFYKKNGFKEFFSNNFKEINNDEIDLIKKI